MLKTICLAHSKLHVSIRFYYFVKSRVILKMPLVTCKEVIEDLIKNGSKNGSKRKNLVSHMIGALPSSES